MYLPPIRKKPRLGEPGFQGEATGVGGIGNLIDKDGEVGAFAN